MRDWGSACRKWLLGGGQSDRTHHRGRLVLLYLLTLLLLNSYAPEPNPGTTPPNPIVSDDYFPCGVCDVSVTYDKGGVECETCGLWYHAHCQSIGPNTYENLNDEDIHWYCAICGNPNTMTAFDLHGVDWPSTSAPTENISFSFCSTPTETTFNRYHSSTHTRANQQNKWK